MKNQDYNKSEANSMSASEKTPKDLIQEHKLKGNYKKSKTQYFNNQ